MTSGDDFQLSTALLRLRRVADFLATISNPVALAGAIIDAINELGSILRDVPGDPEAIDGLAADFRLMANALYTADGDIDRVKGNVPSVWTGQAATKATAALKATQDLIEQAAPAMVRAAGGLEDYADTLRQLKKDLQHCRDQLAHVVHELSSVGGVLSHTWHQVNPFDDDEDLAALIRQAINAITDAIKVFERLRDAADTLRRLMRDVEGKARAGQARSARVSAFDAVQLADAGIGGKAKEENGILTTAQLKLASQKLDALSDADRATMQQLLDGAGSEAERAYLMKALAAGHSVDDIAKFDTLIHGKDEAWLRRNLSLVSAGDTGDVTYNGVPVVQKDGTTCGSTSILVARAMNDPLYTLGLTTDNGNDPNGTGFRDRLAAEEQRIHDRTNTAWPQALGTTPWGVSDEMNKSAESFGTQYDWRLVDDTSKGSVNPALDDAVGAVDHGRTVPVLIGDSYPHHYVLLVGHEGSDLVFYEPTNGQMVRVSESDFRDGKMDALGYHHVQGVITPK
jgi:uncharacterized protein YukE